LSQLAPAAGGGEGFFASSSISSAVRPAHDRLYGEIEEGGIVGVVMIADGQPGDPEMTVGGVGYERLEGTSQDLV